MSGGWDGTTRYDAERLPRRWAQTRRRIMRRYAGVCHVCGQPGATDIDHVIAGDDHRDENLRPIHGRGSGRSCHADKSSAEGNRAKAAKQARMYRAPQQHPGYMADTSR